MGLGVGDEVMKEISDLNKEFGIKLTTNISKGTPIDTGNADGNVFINFKKDRKTKTEFKGRKKQAINFVEMKAMTATFNIDMTNPFYVRNNVPYANRLALGWSKQAPSGYIDIILINTLNEVYK